MERLTLKWPSLPKQILAELHLRQIPPQEICRDKGALDALYRKYPCLAGDTTAIGEADSFGKCQSWQGDWDWYKDILEKEL